MRGVSLIILFNSFFLFSQNEIIPTVEVLSNKKFHIINHPKSLINFHFNLPNGYHEYREGNDNTLLNIFKKKYGVTDKTDFYGNKIYEREDVFSITILKYQDYPKYKKLLLMDSEQINDLIKTNLLNRDKVKFPNEFYDFYETNGRFWIITGSWDKEKNIYMISSSTYLKNQSINFIFTTKEHLHIYKKSDVTNLKKMVNSFKIIN